MTNTATAATVNVYSNIHKAIRAELFGTVTTAASLDASNPCARAALADRLDALVLVLASHAHHEDVFIQPLVEAHVPELADAIVADHALFDAQIEDLAKGVRGATTVGEVHELHLELARFTGSYLHHQDLEERQVQPALVTAVGPQVLFETEQALVASIPPEEMAQVLPIMLPAMNIDDRAEMLGGMRAGAPAEVFAGVWALAESVLQPADHAALAARLGLG
jgi:hypothetical protein